MSTRSKRGSHRSVHPPSFRTDRGQAISVMMLAVVAALIMIAGLVIDGGQKATAVSRAESVAAGAARAAADAGAAGTLEGGDGSLAAQRGRAAAMAYLDGAAIGSGPGIDGVVRVSGDHVLVSTHVRVATIFLSIIGIDELEADGQATARVVATR